METIFVEKRRQSEKQNPGLLGQLKTKSRRRRAELSGLANVESIARGRNDVLPELTLVHLPVAELRPASRRLRTHDSVHIREVMASISALGFCVPVLLGKRNEILDGEIRVEAARRMGLVTVPCVRTEHLSDAEQRTLRLAINRIGEKGQWDLAELRLEFQELILAEAPIEISGFTPLEIDQIVLDDTVPLAERGPLVPEEGARAVAQVGDIFQLGPHRLGCGDATDAGFVRQVMDGDSPARVVLTDEPYNVPISGHVTSGTHREFVMGSGEMDDAQFLDFNLAWMRSVLPALNDGGILGTFMDWRGYPIVHAAARQLELALLNCIIWTKTNAGMGSFYRSQFEALPLFKKGSVPHVNNIALGKHGRWRSNVWNYPGASSLGSDARRGLQDHPTVKPTAMLEDALLDLSNRGEIVIDPFLGSGSTLIAAEKTGRVCRSIELDPLYVDVAIRRYVAATGGEAILMQTGETFSQVAQRRLREERSEPETRAEEVWSPSGATGNTGFDLCSD